MAVETVGALHGVRRLHPAVSADPTARVRLPRPAPRLHVYLLVLADRTAGELGGKQQQLLLNQVDYCVKISSSKLSSTELSSVTYSLPREINWYVQEYL